MHLCCFKWRDVTHIYIRIYICAYIVYIFHIYKHTWLMNTMFSWFSFELYKWLWTARGLLGGIWVVNSVYNWGGADAGSAADPVLKSKDHPAILMWTIGTLAVGLIVVDVPDAFAYPDAQRILLGPPPPPQPMGCGWVARGPTTTPY